MKLTRPMGGRSKKMASRTHRYLAGKETLSSPMNLAYLLTPPMTAVHDQMLSQEMRLLTNHSTYHPCYGSHSFSSRGSIHRRCHGLSGARSSCFPLSHSLLRRRTRALRKSKLEHQPESPALVSFSSLPQEVVQEIFSYLSQRELCLLAQVSRAWRDYAYDPIHWQKLSFELNHNLGLQVLKSITERAPLLRKLSLHGQENLMVSTEVDFFTKSCSLLVEIDLSYLSTVGQSVIHILCQNCQALQSLSVEGCTLVDDCCVSMLCQELPGLRTLNMCGCTLLGEQSVIRLALGLSQIRKLNIDSIPSITDRSIAVLSQKHLETLQCLHIDGTCLTDDAMKAVAFCSKLRHLCVSNAENMTDSALIHIQRMSGLQELQLRRISKVTAEGLRHLFHEPSLQSLRFLDLTECCVLDDSCVMALVQCCGHCLHHLSLSLCWNVSDVGLEALVQGCRKLQHLNLLGLDGITGEPLHQIPDLLAQLVYMDLRQCGKIKDELMVDVVKRRPKLTILNYYGEEFRPVLETRDSRSRWMALLLQVLVGFVLLELLVALICMC